MLLIFCLIAIEIYGTTSIYFIQLGGINQNQYTACGFDIRLYLTPLEQARQFRETCGT
jgi:hypothetical protein